MTDNYAFSPEGKELLILDIALMSIFVYKTIFWLIIGNLIVFTVKQTIRRNYKMVRIGAILTILFYLIIGQIIQKKCAPDYYTIFINQSTMEGLLERPIIKAGYHIGPIITKEISNKGMKNRIYAIEGLGKIKYKPSIQVLKSIIYDKTEIDYIRAEALQTLMSFNNKEAKRIFNDFINQVDKPSDQKVIDLLNTWIKPTKQNGSH